MGRRAGLTIFAGHRDSDGLECKEHKLAGNNERNIHRMHRFSQIHPAAATICENLCNLWINSCHLGLSARIRGIRGFYSCGLFESWLPWLRTRPHQTLCVYFFQVSTISPELPTESTGQV